MKQIKTLFALLCTVLVLASCNKDSIEETAPQNPTDVAQLINIAPFPAFSEGAQTRAIGIEDPGKTTWESGDEVLLEISLTGSGIQTKTHAFTLTYDGAKWTADKSLNITLPDYRVMASIKAYYAPNYEWVADQITHKSGKIKGTSEYFVYTADGVKLTNGITINFANTARAYSRLRVATLPKMEIKVVLSDFTPVNDINASNKTFTLTADANGNAYLYGTWKNNITVSTTDASPVELAKKTGLSQSTANRSYALDAFPQATDYKARGAGTANDPYLIWNAAQLQSLSTATASGSKIFEGQHIKLTNNIDCSTLTEFTPIGNSDKKFVGTFDGGGRTIRNLTLGIATSPNGVVYSGFFAYAEKATISNLTLLDPRLSENAKQTAEHIGALIGFVAAPYTSSITTITNCHVSLSSGSTATLESTNTDKANAGGLIGQCRSTTLIACSSAISVRTVDRTSGGLISNGGNITMIGCRTTGAVTGESTGGLAGVATQSGISIVGCSTSGALSGKYAGGFVGNNTLTTVLSSYCASSENSGQYPGSFMGYNVGTFNLYYSAATSNWGEADKGVGRVGNSTTNAIGEQFNLAHDALYGAMVNEAAEAKWQSTEFDAIRTAAGNKTLAEIWVNTPGAAPRLWWEK